MPGPSLGINLSGVVDWSTALPFVDIFKQSRSWVTSWDSNENNALRANLDLDENGWVRNFALDPNAPAATQVTTVVFTYGNEYTDVARPGRYILDYDGEGDIQVSGGLELIASESTDGRLVFEMPNDGTAQDTFITISETDPNNTGDYIRNVRLYHEDDTDLINNGVVFNPAYIEKIEDFRTLRFMDWMATNNSDTSEWADQRDANSARYASGSGEETGVPVEIMVQLANEVRADPWFTIPHLASDEWIREFATYVRDNLDPGLVARFEYSNEVWNWGFEQAQWANAQAQQAWGNPEGGWMQWYGVKAANMANIVADVFGEETGERALNVFATQEAWPGLQNYALDAPAHVAEGGTAPKEAPFHVYSIANYFGGDIGVEDNTEQVREWISQGEQGFQNALAHLRNVSLPALEENVEYHAGVADSLGWRLDAYEGGQHIVNQAGLFGGAQDAELNQFFVDLVRRPEFEELYYDWFDSWREAGGDLAAHYTDVREPGQYGSWGIWDTVYSENTPRAEAIETILETIEAWWDDPRPASNFESGPTPDPDPIPDPDPTPDPDPIPDPDPSPDPAPEPNPAPNQPGELGEAPSGAILTGTALADELVGGAAADMMTGGAGSDSLDGGAGADTADYGAEGGGLGVKLNLNSGRATDSFGDTDLLTSIENVFGTAADDALFGNGADNWLEGGAGADAINAKDGDDTILGGAGADKLVGGGGADMMLGGDGDDVLGGRTGDDDLQGGAGADRLFGQLGDDILDGGDGDDALNGGVGDDVIFGGQGDDVILGRSGADWLDGGAGDDRINGGTGGDTLIGADGDDVLIGGADADFFVYDAANFGADTLQRFQVESDTIRIDNALAASFDDLTITQGENGAEISFAGGSITLVGVDEENINPTLFDFF